MSRSRGKGGDDVDVEVGVSTSTRVRCESIPVLIDYEGYANNSSNAYHITSHMHACKHVLQAVFHLHVHINICVSLRMNNPCAPPWKVVAAFDYASVLPLLPGA